MRAKDWVIMTLLGLAIVIGLADVAQRTQAGNGRAAAPDTVVVHDTVQVVDTLILDEKQRLLDCFQKAGTVDSLWSRCLDTYGPGLRP